jgi:hypothetical protein
MSRLRWLEDAENNVREQKLKMWKQNQTVETSVAKKKKTTVDSRVKE